MQPSFLDGRPAGRAPRFNKPLALLPGCDLEPGGAWVDLGCGDGVFTAVLAHLLGGRACVLGLDRDRRALMALRANLDRWDLEAPITPLLADFTEPLPLKGLDGALAANALHFVPHAEKDQVLEGLAAGVRSGGRLVIVEYNADTGTPAVPYPHSVPAWLRRLERLGLRHVALAARTRSSYLGEMVAVQAWLP